MSLHPDAYCFNRSYKGILMKFCGEVERGTGRNQLNFGGDPELADMA